MSVLLSIGGLLARLPRPAVYVVLITLAVGGIAIWHGHRIDAAYADGSKDQANIDRARVANAAAAAAAVQQRLVATLAARQAVIAKGTEHALVIKNTDLARRYADVRLRWAASSADRDGPGAGRATAIPDATASPDDATCATRGWVSFDTAATAAEAADRAIAEDDAWIAWAALQAKAWPK